eukprot:scaffold54834_cov57-Phaeocystis_antarctica.AAC.4
MIGTLHDGEALNAHERPQPVKLLPHSLGEAAQALDHVEEGHVIGTSAAGHDDLQECVVRLRARPHRRQQSFARGRNSSEPLQLLDSVTF